LSRLGSPSSPFFPFLSLTSALVVPLLAFFFLPFLLLFFLSFSRSLFVRSAITQSSNRCLQQQPRQRLNQRPRQRSRCSTLGSSSDDGVCHHESAAARVSLLFCTVVSRWLLLNFPRPVSLLGSRLLSPRVLVIRGVLFLRIYWHFQRCQGRLGPLGVAALVSSRRGRLSSESI
jgi:hypothetical protein